MFTQNYINMQFNRFFGRNSGNSGGINTQTITTTKGTIMNSFHADNDYDEYFPDIGRVIGSPKYTSTQTSTLGGVVFGSGTTPASLSDYDLESQITSGLSTISCSRNVGREEDGRFCVYGQYALKNISDAALSISEIGIVQELATSSNNPHCVLLERTVLDEPVVINPNEIKLITYKLIFNQGMYA